MRQPFRAVFMMMTGAVLYMSYHTFTLQQRLDEMEGKLNLLAKLEVERLLDRAVSVLNQRNSYATANLQLDKMFEEVQIRESEKFSFGPTAREVSAPPVTMEKHLTLERDLRERTRHFAFVNGEWAESKLPDLSDEELTVEIKKRWEEGDKQAKLDAQQRELKHKHAYSGFGIKFDLAPMIDYRCLNGRYWLRNPSSDPIVKPSVKKDPLVFAQLDLPQHQFVSPLKRWGHDVDREEKYELPVPVGYVHPAQ